MPNSQEDADEVELPLATAAERRAEILDVARTQRDRLARGLVELAWLHDIARQRLEALSHLSREASRAIARVKRYRPDSEDSKDR